MIYQVNGTVSSSNTEYFNCVTFSKLKIRAYSVGYGTITEITEREVNPDGTFSFEVESSATSHLIKLFYTTEISDVFVAESSIFCHHDDIIVDFSINESEHTTELFTEIYDRIKDKCFEPSIINVLSLTEEQIKEISCLTCITEKMLLRFQTAYRLYNEFLSFDETLYTETETGIDLFKDYEDSSVSLIFGLLGRSSQGDLADVFTHSYTQFDEILAEAIEKNEISDTLNSGDNKDILISCRDGLLFNANNDDTYYDAKLIHLSENTYNSKKNLLNASLDSGGFVSIIPSAPEEIPDPVIKVMRLLPLDRHTMHFPPMLKNAVNNIVGEPDYYELTLEGPDFWMGIIESFPEQYTSAEEYAQAIYESIAEDIPSARLSRNLSGSGITDATTMKTVLDDFRDFNIEEHSVASFFSTDDNEPNFLEAETMQKMQKLQRSVKLSGDREDLTATKVMIQQGLSSSYAITRKGKSGFADLMHAEGGIAKEISEKIYCRAAAMNSTISMLMAQYKRYESKDALMPSSLKDPQYEGEALPNLPDLESLFGSLDTCSCSECQSVYSPAAYLTDLLHWLGTSVVCSNGDSGFDALMELNSDNRRKDIRYLKLNCKNTNTLVPYIDLVNEILSANLLADVSGNTDADVIAAYQTLQTTKTADELLTEPEHRFPDAEALLKTNYFQWALPYDSNYDASISYLKKLNKPYADIVNAFTSEAAQYDNWLWSQAFLGLSVEQASVITTDHSSDPAFWKKFWGLQNSDLLDNTVIPATPGVGAVLKSADISLPELQDILTAYYINELTPVTIVPYPGDECDVDKYTFSPKFTKSIADRFMRFLRLKRVTGLTTTELDLAIINHSPVNGIDQAFLTKLASHMAFTKQYNLSFTDVQMFFNANGYVDHYTSTTASDYFKNKFRNPLLPADVIDFFTTDVFSTHVNDLTNGDKQKLSKIFKVSIPMLEIIIGLKLTGNPLLTFTNLSVLDRYSTFAKVFGVTENDFQSVMDHMGDPFSVLDIVKEMWSLSNVFALFEKLKMGLKDFISVVGMTGINDVGSPEMLAKAEELWNKLETAYQKERAAHPEKEFDTATPYLPTDTLDKTYFENVIVENLRLPFGFNFQDTKDMVDTYSSTWLEAYIADPEGKDAPRNWMNRGIYFMPVYQMLNRTALLTKIYGMDAGAISKAADAKIRSSLTLPDDYFYWFTNAVPTIDLGMLLWPKKVVEQAALLDIRQADYLDLIEDYTLDNVTGYTAVDDSKIIALYNNLGADSAYKALSVFEFTQTFLRAQIIATGTNTQNIIFVLDAFQRIFDTVSFLGYNVSDGWNWVWNATSDDFNYVGDYSADIRRVLHNKYTDFKTWSDVIVPVQNELRAKLRDALVALYIGTRDFKNENAIYAYYLLDTQMAPCNQTSRVVAAVSSAQLLVHRALLGIEAHVCMKEDDKNEWEWRKNYRVWEANRKVFLYPENWIDPSLRTNKTSIFKNTEDLLQQDDINQKNTEQAFAGYLTGLNDVAHLDIRATLIEKPSEVVPCGNSNSDTLHVFARSWNPPYIHYYRKRKNNVWTAWEKIELEIDSDHLIPVIFNRKLYVFFPLFVEKQHRVIKTSLNGELVNSPYLEIRMCYTKQDAGKWSNKKVLDGILQAGTISGVNIPNTEAGLINKLRKKLEVAGDVNSKIIDWKKEKNSGLLWSNDTITDYAYTSLKKESFYFWPEVNPQGDLRIHCRRDYHEDVDSYHNGYTHMANEWGFLIGACDEKVKIVPPVPANDILSRPYMTLPYFEQMKKGKDYGAVVAADDGLWVKTSLGHAPLSDRLFKKTNGDYVLTYPQQYLHNISGQPFFYADGRHSLFIDSSKKVSLHEHPYTCKMLEALNRFGIDGLLNSKETNGLRRQASNASFFYNEYNPVGNIPTPYPVMDFDFSSTGAYSIYNWEVFFHTVSLIARQLRQSNKFEDALKWINYIFDPANRDMSLQDLRYWKIKPFLIDVSKGISYYMRLLSAPNLTAAEKEEKRQWEEQIEMWRDHPFDPHLIASMRPRTYMLWTVMELIEILSDWGDFLFRQDTTESINEAINLYVMASEILGERPKKVDRPSPPDFNYDDIMAGLDAFSNASARFENYMTGLKLCKCTDSVSVANDSCDQSPALSTLPQLTFCIPDNPRMTEMWDRVEDRLFKIRNCMNIDGKKRQLALFAPPIDPALLVRATAMGLDLSDVLSDLAAAPPHYRFSYLLQRANDFTNEVKSLGSQLLTALEKKDGEELSVLRQIHEQNILKASRTLKEMQLEEAKQNYSTLQYSKNLIQIRLDDYKNREYQNSREANAQRQTQLAEGFMFAEQGVRILAGLLNLIPDAFMGAPTASGATVFGGTKLRKLIDSGGHALNITSTVNRNKASMSLTYAGYDRRQEEWNLQIKSATEELLQVDRQLLSAEIRIAIAEKELENHDLQAAQSAEIYDWLKSKYTNQALYTWMAGQLKTLHRKSYDLAYDLAKQAQQAFYRDLGAGADTAKINFGNWDSSRAGFFAGERLSIQLKELETSYIQHNTRDYELSKNISLALLDPSSLEDLRATGKCIIKLPEVLFDMDYPSHYFRRIKSVGITIPGIAGPYTTVGATLTMTASSVRTSSNYSTGVLISETSSIESIATSSAQNDSGVFEMNFRDERYMPFEYKGAVSEWTLELSDIARQFDYTSISDVIMHMQYTAKEAGSIFANAVKGAFKAKLNATFSAGDGLYYAMNLKHDLPNQWHELKTTGTATLQIPKNRLPYFAQALNLAISDVAVAAYTDVTNISGYNLSVNAETIALPPSQNPLVYMGSSASTVVALDTDFALTVSGVSGALPLSDTSELVILVKLNVS